VNNYHNIIIGVQKVGEKNQMKITLSKQLIKWLGVSDAEEVEVRKELNERLKNIIKPCWELKFCPYGPLVEDFPLPPTLLEENREHKLYLKRCLELGKMGTNFDMPLDDERRKYFEKELNANTEEGCASELSEFEKEASCQEFGHLCPAYFVSEPFTETSEGRNRRRNLSHATILRVVRRDNSACQSCGKTLLDKEIEIDHIIPYSRGGSSDESNLRVTCLKCNRKKGRKVDL